MSYVSPSKQINNFEDVRPFGLDDDAELDLLTRQCECTFIWVNRNGDPVGVTMSYLFRDGRFWLTASARRARTRAIARDPRVSIVVSSLGTTIGRGRSVTYKGHAVVHDAPEVKSWFYPELAAAVRPGQPDAATAFVEYLDSADRLIIEVTPADRIGFDGAKMWQAAPDAAPIDGPPRPPGPGVLNGR